MINFLSLNLEEENLIFFIFDILKIMFDIIHFEIRIILKNRDIIKLLKNIILYYKNEEKKKSCSKIILTNLKQNIRI